MTVGQDNLWNYPNLFARRLHRVIRSPHVRTVLGFLLFETAYYFAYRWGMAFGETSASPFWFPDSVLLCALLKSRPQQWWLFVLGTLPIRLFSEVAQDIPLWFLVATFAIDTAKGLSAALLLRRYMRNPLRFETVREFATFAFFAVLLVPAASAVFGAAVRAIRGADYASAFIEWFMGDALAQLVVTPAILYWVFAGPWNVKALDTRRLLEACVLTAGLVVTGYRAAAGTGSVTFAEPRFYAPVPFLFWAALRFGMRGASGAVAILAFFVVKCALEGTGPFVGLDPGGTAFALQNFLLLRAAPLYLVAALIEQRRDVERSLEESEERFRSVANSAPVLLWMSGPDKLGQFFNQGWLAFTGRTMEQELGDGWIQGVHPDDVQHCLDVCHKTFDTRQPFEVEYRLRRHDGEYRWVIDVGTPRFAPNGEFLGYIGSALDITDRKAAEESNRALAHVQRLALVGELTAAIAHELRQPLSAILSNAEAGQALLDSGKLPLEELREIVADIQSADLRANDVLNYLQDFIRKRDTRMEPLEINRAISDLLPLIANDARTRRIRIHTELGENLPPIWANRTQLQQVLINLMVNAMDAMSSTPEGKRQMTLQTRPDGDGHVEVAVADCGSGIAPENLPRLFDSFFATRPDGMGLGLSIVRSIVHSHRGRIWAENNESGGATFRFTVPVARADTSASRGSADAQSVAGSAG